MPRPLPQPARGLIKVEFLSRIQPTRGPGLPPHPEAPVAFGETAQLIGQMEQHTNIRYPSMRRRTCARRVAHHDLRDGEVRLSRASGEPAPAGHPGGVLRIALIMRFRHEPAVEKVLQAGAVKVDSASPPETDPVVSVELRNGSAKSISSDNFAFTATRGERTDHFGARGNDLVYAVTLHLSPAKAGGLTV
jgi:hypothetical protein